MDLFGRQKQHIGASAQSGFAQHRAIFLEADEPPSPNTDAAAYVVRTGTTVNPGVPVLVVWSGGVRYETAMVAV